MKKTLIDFLKANGFYLSFGLGIVTLVAALVVYNVNSSKDGANQDINLNAPMESEATEQSNTKDIADAGDMDVPMDMQEGESAERTQDSVETIVVPEAQKATEDASAKEVDNAGMKQVDVSGEETKEVSTDNVLSYTPLSGLEFIGMEEVSMPVLGNVIMPYSMDTTIYFKTLGLYRCNPGIMLQAPVGTEVVSIWHGQVTDIRESKEYGTMITVNLGSGYQMIYGQLEDVRVVVGDEVYKDTVLGKVAEPTAYYQLEGSHVFFEMLKDGEPINPYDVLQLE